MHASLNIALKAARSASEILSRQVDRLDRIRILEAHDKTPVCSAQMEAEQAILQVLQKSFPKQGFHSVTEGLQIGADKTAMWQINGLVGSENFLRGAPGFLVSISCLIDDAVKLMILLDPLFNEEFTAVRGAGASLNGKRIRVTGRTHLEECLVALPATERDANLDQSVSLWRRLSEASAGIRISGCGILDICYVAAGRFDGAIVQESSPLSLPGALLLLREAGGLVSDLQGNPDAQGDTLVLGNPKCFKQVLQSVRHSGN